MKIQHQAALSMQSDLNLQQLYSSSMVKEQLEIDIPFTFNSLSHNPDF